VGGDHVQPDADVVDAGAAATARHPLAVDEHDGLVGARSRAASHALSTMAAGMAVRALSEVSSDVSSTDGGSAALPGHLHDGRRARP
jgi:hypothetical protein